MPAVFITGSGTDVGKTFVACGLIRALRLRGVAVGALKPVVSGFDPLAWENSDPGRLLRALGQAPTSQALAALSPWRYAAPLAPDLAASLEGRAVDFNAVAEFCMARTAAEPDRLWLIEGVGGVMSPVSESRTGVDLMMVLSAPVVLVAGGYLGAISHALTALSVLEAHKLTVAAVVVSGGAPNDPPLDETVASLARFAGSIPMLSLPRDEDPTSTFGVLAARLSDGAKLK